MIYSIFDTNTGIVIGHLTVSAQSQTVLNRTDIVPGQHPIGLTQVKDGKVMAYTPPIEVTLLRQAQQIRTQRDKELAAVDRVNPMWWASLSDHQQTQLQTYRQDLLNIPQQAGFPGNIVWPVRPEWLTTID